MKRLIVIILAAVVSGLVFFSKDIALTLNIVSGFSAKNLCSGHYNSGFSLNTIESEALAPISPAMHLVSYHHDQVNRRIVTNILGSFEREAIFREGLGCTLLGVGQKQLHAQIKPYTFAPLSNQPWPEGLGEPELLEGVDYELLSQAIDNAFTEPRETAQRHTKAVVIIHKGKLIAERYAKPLTKTTPLLSWSMAKSVTNLLLARLINQSAIDIFAPAPVKAWQEPDDPRGKITIDQMLRMSTGLEFNEQYGINSDVAQMLSTEVSVSQFAQNKPLLYKPDTHWAYASGTSNILADIVFEQLGPDLQSRIDKAQQLLFEPLKIHSALLETDGSDTFIGSSYFYASPRDWAKLGQLMMQDGIWNGKRLLPEGWVNYSTTATAKAPDGEYAAHIWLKVKAKDGTQKKWIKVPEDSYFFSGYQGQFVVIIPSADLIIVRNGFTVPNTDSGIETLITEVMEAVVGR